MGMWSIVGIGTLINIITDQASIKNKAGGYMAINKYPVNLVNDLDTYEDVSIFTQPKMLF